MSATPRPRLKSLTPNTNGPRPAEPAAPRPDLGEPKGVAAGVPTVVCPNEQTTNPLTPTPELPGIRIYAPPVYRHHEDGARWSKRYSDTPTAASACACGETATATGAQQVASLIAAYSHHRTTACPLLTPQEGRAAA